MTTATAALAAAAEDAPPRVAESASFSSTEKRSGGRKRFRLSVCATGETFDLLVYPDVEPRALSNAVSSRSGCDDFYLTETSDDFGPVVPLSSALPDGAVLVVHDASGGGERRRRRRRGEEEGIPAKERAPPPLPSSSFGVHGPPAATKSAGEGAQSSLTEPFLDEPPDLLDDADESPRPSSDLEAASSRLRRRRGNFDPSADDFDDPRRSNMSIEEHVATELDALERLNRLTTDLANERNLLAWFRTSLAGVRTAFAYLAVSSSSTGWEATVIASEIGIATFVVLSAAGGYLRYRTIRKVLVSRIPPREFGRPSVKPLTALLMLTVGITAVGIYSHRWGRNQCKNEIV